MSDFDFDELDKAVNNVLSDKDMPEPTSLKPAESKNMDNNTDNDTSDSLGSDTSDGGATSQSAPAEPTPVSTPTEPPVHIEPPAPIVKPRSSINRMPPASGAKRGGVIDIMAPPSKRPSRESAALQPAGQPGSKVELEEKSAPLSVPRREPSEDAALRWPPKTDEPEKSEAPELEKPATEALETKSSIGANIEPDGSFERFDSLSRSGFGTDKTDTHEEAAEKPTLQPEAVPAESGDGMAKPNEAGPEVPAPETDGQDTLEKEPASPQSPFLSDAKVEKRPLGAFSATKPAEPEELKTPVEADKAEAAEPKPEEEKKLEVGNEHLLEDGHEHEVAPSKEAKTTPPAGAMESIPQQYKIAAQPHDEAPHKAFDTNEYHAPLHGHDAKAHKGGNGLLIASIVLLVVAVVAAAGIYFYGDKLGL